VLFGAVLGWLRLRSGSVWPAVIGHGALNATAGLVLFVGDAAHPPNPALAGIVGVVGWPVLAVVAALLLAPRLAPVSAVARPRSGDASQQDADQ
jgi:hypothetical protein